MKTIRLNLFYKFIIVTILIVLIFGFINILFLWKSVYKSFEKEIDKRCIVLSKIISDKIVNPMVYGDILSIYNILDNIKESDDNVAYIFIIDASGSIVAQSSNFKMPKSLITANSLKAKRQNIKIIETKNYKYKIIRDIAYPILDGEIGTIRLGLVENDIRDDLRKTTIILLIMISSFLIIGLLGALFFSYLITFPIKQISNRATNINFKSISEVDYKMEYPKYKKFGNLYFEDELDTLDTKFSEMLIRLKKSYAELQASQDSAIHAEKLASIGTLVAGLAHEINNPISGINNCLRRISKDPNNVQQNIAYIELIHDATAKIEGIVKRLLNFSKKQTMVFDKVQTSDIVTNAILLAAAKIKKYDIVIEKDIEQASIIYGSKNHLEQVLLNLILNSIDSIAEKKSNNKNHLGKIHIFTEISQKYISLHVKDNGMGIKSELKNKLFDPFFTTKDVGKGTGLGLYVSYDIIKKHNGTLSFSDTKEGGAEFKIILMKNKDLEI